MKNEAKKIIAVVGKTGSGKDFFSNYIKDEFESVDSFRFSQPLTEALGFFFDKIKKEDQQWLSSALRDNYGEDILAKAIIKKIEKSEKEIIILNGARVEEDVDMVKSINGKVIFIDCEAYKRWERIKGRGEKEDDNISFDKFSEMDQNRTEKQIENLKKESDFIIDNNGTVNDFKKEINRIINIIKNE